MSVDEPVVILFRGGRLPTWFQLDRSQRERFEQAHVDLMLTVAKQHHLSRLEGFRLVTPGGAWTRFWVIEFPTLTGAEAWMNAERAPEYGRYGFFDYQLARQKLAKGRRNWLQQSDTAIAPLENDPHQIPTLAVELDSVIVLLCEWDSSATRQTPGHEALVPSLSAELGVRQLELFELLAPRSTWDRVWLAELNTLADAELWVEAVASAGQSDETQRHFHLTRKWAPAYFASWLVKR